MPEGDVIDAASGGVVAIPGAQPALLALARCAALCNDSTLYIDEGAGAPQHVGENTEVALRVLAEKVQPFCFFKQIYKRRVAGVVRDVRGCLFLCSVCCTM